MNFKNPFVPRGISSERRHKFCQNDGFTLIVTLMLMIILTIMAIAMLSLSAISLRSSGLQAAQAEARTNARMAIMIAIGQVQKELGGDQFATAQATILATGAYGSDSIPPPNPSSPASEYSGVKNPHWLAAFPTYDPDEATATERPFYIRRPSDTRPGADLYLYDSRYCNENMTSKRPRWQWLRIGSGENQVQWLVSNPRPDIKLRADKMTPDLLAGTSADFTTISATGAYKGPLLYPSTTSSVLGTPPDSPNTAPALATIEARAPIVPVKDVTGNFKGAYAYMVSDDSLKYKISLHNSVQQTAANAPKTSDAASFAQLLSPQNTHLEGLFLSGRADAKLRKLNYNADTDSSKNATLSTLPLQSNDPSLASQASTQFIPFYQHSFTPHGYGLLTDPTVGGLKKNLTSYLERPSSGPKNNQQITPIRATDATELGSSASGVVQDSISDTSSLLYSLKDKDPISGSLTAGSMTSYSDPQKRLTWFAPVFGLLRDYTQLRTSTAGDPVIDARAATQATGLFQNAFGAEYGGFDEIMKSTSEPSAMTSWDSDRSGFTAAAYLPGSGPDKRLAPAMGVHPVMIKAAAYMYPAYDSKTRKVAFLVYPRVILFNPYNVKLEGRKYVISIKRNTSRFGAYYSFQHPSRSVNHALNISNGAEIPETLSGNANDLVFLIDNTNHGMMPGESLLFCPDTSQGDDIRGGGRFSKLYRAFEGNVDKMVLTCTSRPTAGNAFYVEGPDFPEWGSGSISVSTVNLLSSSPKTTQESKQMVKLFLPSSRANFSAPLTNTASLRNYSLLQAVEANGRYERNGWTCPHPGTTPLTKDKVPDLSEGSSSEPGQFSLAFLHHAWVGKRLVRANELEGNTCLSGSGKYSLLTQYDIRAPYVGHTWDASPKPVQPDRMTGDGQVDYYSEQSSVWVWARDGTSSTLSDPLHVLSNDAPLSASGRGGINVMSAFMRTGTLSSNKLNCPMFELPRKNVPLISLGELRNARLNAFIGGPTYTIGNSYGSRLSPRSGSAPSWEHLMQVYEITTGWKFKRTYFSWFNYSVPHANVPSWVSNMFQPFHYQIYDQSYEANHSLWDRFFLTGVEGDPSSGASSLAAASLPSAPDSSDRIDTTQMLPNPRLLANPLRPPPLKSEVVSYYKASESLVIDGAFNVNSTDPLAWQALLSSFRKIDIPMSSSETLEVGDSSPFSRILTPPLNRSGIPTGLTGSGPVWQQVRCLTDAQIEKLSLLIVEQVKQRAPFISVSDFVNRRLIAGDLSSGCFGPSRETNTSEWGLKGPLQAAIDDSGFNAFTPVDTNDTAIQATPGTNNAYSPTSTKNRTASSKYADALGYLTQGDILAKIGSVLTIRGDTFTIRGYGDSRDARGNIIASARCEATIQRIPEYLDTVADPLPQASFASLKSDTNRLFGRQFKIIAFRWLTPTE